MMAEECRTWSYQIPSHLLQCLAAYHCPMATSNLTLGFTYVTRHTVSKSGDSNNTTHTTAELLGRETENEL